MPALHIPTKTTMHGVQPSLTCALSSLISGWRGLISSERCPRMNLRGMAGGREKTGGWVHNKESGHRVEAQRPHGREGQVGLGCRRPSDRMAGQVGFGCSRAGGRVPSRPSKTQLIPCPKNRSIQPTRCHASSSSPAPAQPGHLPTRLCRHAAKHSLCALIVSQRLGAGDALHGGTPAVLQGVTRKRFACV